MTIWLLAILLLAAVAALGMTLGAIRTACAFLGIFLGAVLASPLGGLIKPLVSSAGLKDPLWLSVVPPCIVFFVILIVFKVIGFAVHKKIEVHYKHRMTDWQWSAWERLNRRLGLCVGLLNGTAYLILASAAVYIISYWTYQLATDESNPTAMRIVNRLGADLQSSGMSKVAAAVDKMPDAYYQAADIVGLIYHNPLLEARLSRYPAFFALGERPEFQDLGSDPGFNEALLTNAPVADILKNPKVQSIINNRDILKIVMNTILPDLPDLRTFLETGKSAKFTEPLLGRWDFSAGSTLALWERAAPNMPAAQRKALQQSFEGYYNRDGRKTTLIIAPGGSAYLENFPRFRPGNPPIVELQHLEGQWSGENGRYQIQFNFDSGQEVLNGVIDGNRLALDGASRHLAFLYED